MCTLFSGTCILFSGTCSLFSGTHHLCTALTFSSPDGCCHCRAPPIQVYTKDRCLVLETQFTVCWVAPSWCLLSGTPK